MPATITIFDETTTGEKTESLAIEFENTRITARELIRRRVYEEVLESNEKTPGYFRGLVQPTDAERVLNGYKLKKIRKIDWEEQYERAIESFESNGFFILIDDRQIESLDEEIEVAPQSQVSFVKLVPLVGG